MMNRTNPRWVAYTEQAKSPTLTGFLEWMARVGIAYRKARGLHRNATIADQAGFTNYARLYGAELNKIQEG